MGDTYSIGKFRFETYREYQEALDDVEKIRYISENTDINEPGMAQRLYTLIRQGKINFKSVIGTDYMLYLSDIMMEDAAEQANEKRKKAKKVQKDRKEAGAATKTRTAKEKKEEKEAGWTITIKPIKLSARQIVGALCMVGAVISFLVFACSEYRDRQKTKELEELKEEQQMALVAEWVSDRFGEKLEEARQVEEEPIVAESQIVENVVHTTEQQIVPAETEVAETEPQILPEYQDMYQRNPDFVGWLSIGGTQIDYPVMQSGVEEPDYYLHYNYDGQEDINGSIMLDARNNYLTPDNNLILYGHNMKSGMMFGTLKQYLDRSYWEEHQILTFNTLYERSQYQIVAVCLTQVAYQDESGIRYYDFINAQNEAEFQEYVAMINACNVFQQPVELTYGDQLLTLSTCNSYAEDGRLFLIAKKCS